eukprot:tig00000113_g5646.t1
MLPLHCSFRVLRVENHPLLGLPGPDVDPRAQTLLFNFTSGAPYEYPYVIGYRGSYVATGSFSREVPASYLENPSIQPGEALRTYVYSLSCAFNEGLPEPAKFVRVSMAPLRIEIRKPAAPA